MSLADIRLSKYNRVLEVDFMGHKYPVYVLMEKLLKIIDKNAKCIDFVLWEEQIELYEQICLQKMSGKPVRVDILKARQIGYSTFIAGLLFIITMFTPNIRTGVVADTEAHAKNLFSKYQFFYDHLDDNNPKKDDKFYTYKPALKYARGQQFLQTLYSNSTIEVVVAGDNAGRSANYHLLHCSECAFFPNLKLTLNSLLETVSSSNLDSMVFLETTANGFNEYKERWDKDLSGVTSYIAFFSPWWKHDEYSVKNASEESIPLLDSWLEEKAKIYNLSLGQIKWINDKYLDKGDKNLTLQEYPFSPVDAFITSGNCIFDPELIAKRKEEIIKDRKSIKSGRFVYQANFSLDGSQIVLKNPEFVNSKNGLIKIYKEVDKTHFYVGVCDPNDEGSDYSAVQIIDNCTGEQVACFQTRELTHDKVAYQFYLLGKMYNNALLSNEMNRGGAIMDFLIKLSYPSLYINQDLEYDSMKQSYKSKYGHKITKSNRPFAIENLKIAFKENPRMINDFDTICEMETFINRERTYMGKTMFKIEASGNNHDDLVMALAGYYIVRNQQTFIPRKESELERKQTNFEMFKEDIKKQRNRNFLKYSGIRF